MAFLIGTGTTRLYKPIFCICIDQKRLAEILKWDYSPSFAEKTKAFQMEAEMELHRAGVPLSQVAFMQGKYMPEGMKRPIWTQTEALHFDEITGEWETAIDAPPKAVLNTINSIAQAARDRAVAAAQRVGQ